MMHGVLMSEEESEEEVEINDNVNEGIRNKKIHAVTETSKNHNKMGECWKIVSFEN